MDDVKERLGDAIGAGATAISDELGDAAVHQILSLAKNLLESGIDVVVEGFFQSNRYSADFASLALGAESVLIHLQAEDSVLKKRYEDRAMRDERHWIHGDADKIGTLKPELPEYMAERLQLDVPQIVIDTTREQIDISAVVQLILRTSIHRRDLV